MNPDDFKDLSDELEAIKKGYTKGQEVGDYDNTIREGEFKKHILSLITSTTVSWDDIVGLDNAKNAINESNLISIIENRPDAIEPCNSILLFGPPGTGKTLLAAATAGTLKATFFNVKTGDLLSKYYGESSKIISALYNTARKHAPSIIFLDEFDSIGSIRNDISEASRRVLSTLLSEMDGLHNKKSSQNVLTMAATNTPWDLDSAILSRFEMRIYVPLPDEQAVMEMIKLNTRKKDVELGEDMQKIAQICVSKFFAGRDVATLCKEAIKNMVREQNNWDNIPADDIKKITLKIRPITKSDFKKALDGIKGTVKKQDIIEHENWAEENGSDFHDAYVKNEHIGEINETEIYRKAQSEKVSERKEAAYEIGKNFKLFNDEKRSAKTLLDLTKDNDSGVRRNVTEAIGSAFKYFNDKDQATNDLLALTKDEKWEVRRETAKAISSSFIHLTDRDRATNDLFSLIKDKRWEVRDAAAKTIGSVYNHFTDRVRATNELFALIKDEKWEVRSVAAEAIGYSFSDLANKDRATEALLKLAEDKDSFVRRNAAEAIGYSFSDLANKDRATEALLTLVKDEDSFVRRNAAEAIGLAFDHLTDKVQAWNDLLVMIKREDGFVLIGAAYALGSAFPYVTDKGQATKALLALISDKDANVRTIAAETFGSIFPYIADKDQVTEKLLALTKDEKSIVRAYANHSLGRAYVFRATESRDEENFRKQLEQALQFFEKSSREETDSQPAGFCLPFYRSFYMLTFKKEEAKAEVQKYLEMAKRAVEGSQSKEKLLEAVKNLGNALTEVQNLKEKDFNDIKFNLKVYRNYCERASEMLDEAEGKAPGAARLVRMGLPIIDERIKGILSGLEITTKRLCEETKGTQLIKLGEEIYGQGRNLPHIKDPIKLNKKINEIHNTLSILCGRLIEEDIENELKILNKINDEQYIENKVEIMDRVMRSILIKMKPKTRF